MQENRSGSKDSMEPIGETSKQNGEQFRWSDEEELDRNPDRIREQEVVPGHPASNLAKGPATILNGTGPRTQDPEHGVDVGLGDNEVESEEEEGGIEPVSPGPPGSEGQVESAYVKDTTGRHFASMSVGGTEVPGPGSSLTVEPAAKSRADETEKDVAEQQGVAAGASRYIWLPTHEAVARKPCPRPPYEATSTDSLLDEAGVAAGQLFYNDKAAGADELLPRFLNKIRAELARPLTKFFARSWRMNKYLEIGKWRM